MTVRGRRVFVGRSAERATFARALDDAAAGSPRIVMVGGEPGVGKSSLCRELALEAGRRGMRVISGQCYEQGSLKLPYLPFVEAIEQYVRAGGSHQAWDETALVARIVPALRTAVSEPAPGDGESPYQLFEAVAGFLRRIGDEQPTVVLLEDLHDADAGTLDLLTHLGRRLGRARLLVVGTYRDTEIDPPHPLSATLATLQRTEIVERIGLRGLSVPEVRELYERMTGATPAAGVAEAVRAQTEGNPLFATETIRHLDAEGLLGAESEAVLRSVPEGLRDVIGRRLGELSTATTNVLSLAAVVGREFRLEILEALSGGSAPQIPRALSEARAARIIEEDVGQGAVGTYRFNHALFRQYLYERIPAAQRVAIHLDCAAAFEARYGSNGDRIDVIAEHLAHSSDPRDLERASCLSEDAARRALAVHAFADGARIARRAIDSFQRAGTEDRERRCELLLLLGDALNHTGQPRIAIDDALEKAFTLAEAAGDRSRALRACLLAREGLQLMHQGGSSFPTETAFWAARLDRHALPGTRERIYADDNLIALDVLRGTFTASDPSFQRLKKRAWQIGDPETCWLAGGSHLMFQRQPVWDEDRLATIDAMLKLPREGVPTHVLQQGLQFLCTVLLEFGHRVRAEQVRDELLALARRSGDLSTRVWAGRMVYFLAVVDGRLEYGLQTLAAPDAEVIASGIFTDPFNRPEAWGFRAMLLVGRKPPLPVPVPSLLAGPDGAPGSRADRLRQALAGTAHWRAGSVLQHALAVGDTESAAVWVDYFKGTRQVTNSLVLINRLLGEAHVLLGHPDEGRASLERGLEQAQAMRFRPEVALTRVSLATALIGYYPGERDEAHEHLGTAIPELREMGMRPGLERAEALLARLEGERPPGTIRDRRAGGLTGREAEVLRLVAAGRTNRQISEELVLSIRTVERHIANIYAKIDAHGKADATAFAIRHNLV